MYTNGTSDGNNTFSTKSRTSLKLKIMIDHFSNTDTPFKEFNPSYVNLPETSDSSPETKEPSLLSI